MLPLFQRATDACTAANAACPAWAETIPCLMSPLTAPVSNITGAGGLSGKRSGNAKLSNPQSNPRESAWPLKSVASPITIGQQARRTSAAAKDFSTISGPIPAGSPTVIPTLGGTSGPAVRITRHKQWEDGFPWEGQIS